MAMCVIAVVGEAPCHCFLNLGLLASLAPEFSFRRGIVLAPLGRQGPRGYDEKMASQNAPANAKRLLKALIDRGNPVAPDGRISQVAAQTGLDEGEIRPAIAYAKAEGWLEDAKFGHTKGWLSITPSGKAAVES
jgi:hypothetical protein